MKTITVNLYEFDELSEESQQKAIENLYDINVDYDWWDSTYDDAKNVHLKITGFNLDRANYCNAEYIYSASDTKKAILENHGKNCETYKTVKKYDLRKGEDEAEEMLKELSEDYKNILNEDYEYRTTREAIIETIKANEYTFEENGKLNNG